MAARVTGRRRTWALAGLLFAVLLAGAAGAFVRWPLGAFSLLTRVQLALSGIHGRRLTVEGLGVHALEGGAGPPVVFVHGLGGQAQDWAPLLRAVVRAGFHVYAMDLPGFGESAKPTARTYSIHEQAHFVEGFLDALHLEQVALVGVSMGGWISASVALEAPRRVGKLVLVDSAGLTFQPTFDMALFAPTTPDQVDALVALLMPHPERLPTFLKEDVVRQGKDRDWVIQRALASMRTGADVLDARFPMLQQPLLLLWGRQDLITPLVLGEAMHRAAPGSVLEVFDGCGHLAFATCGTRMAPRLLQFLAGNGPAAGATVDVPAS